MKLETELKWGPETHLQLQIIAIDAAKENKMKIFEIMTLINMKLLCFCPWWQFVTCLLVHM